MDGSHLLRSTHSKALEILNNRSYPLKITYSHLEHYYISFHYCFAACPPWLLINLRTGSSSERRNGWILSLWTSWWLSGWCAPRLQLLHDALQRCFRWHHRQACAWRSTVPLLGHHGRSVAALHPQWCHKKILRRDTLWTSTRCDELAGATARFVPGSPTRRLLLRVR